MSAMDTDDTPKQMPIAIIGLSGIIGNCKNISQIWDSLYNGKDEINDLTEIRKKVVIDYLQSIDSKFDINEKFFLKGCLFNNPFEFDNDFFNIDIETAKYLNPATRKMLEVSYSSFENAGLTLSSLNLSNTGVYIGYSSDMDEQFCEVIKTLEPDNKDDAIYGNIRSKLSNCISDFFSLKGPSLTIDTSSSSGLVSVYYAIKALQNKECDVAFAGSCKIYCIPYVSESVSSKTKKYFFSSKSKSNKTMAFDNNADGTTCAEGAVGLVLKPLDKAISDGDYIHAVIVGGGLNHNFESSDNVELIKNSKKDLMIKSLKSAEVTADKISYIEADGIGIKKNDCTEISAMSEAFSQMTNNKQFCCVGSVKTNFGHTGCVSGLVGMMKVILSMQNNVIPATLNFTMPNKEIDFINSPFFINNKKFLWNLDIQDSYAVVNSYGFTGTSCCIILKNYTYMKTLFNISGQQNLFVISAKNEHSLIKLCLTYSKVCNNIDYDYDDFVSTLCFKREHYNYRFACVFTNYSELSQILIDFIKSKDKLDISNAYYGVVNFDNIPTKLIGVISLCELARFYVKGGEITKKYIKLASNKTVSLPTYEFLETDCYLNVYEAYITTRKKYDLINGPCIKSRNQILYKTQISCEKYWEIGTFLFEGKNTLSLGSIFEIILEAISPESEITFNNIIIDNMFQISDSDEKELVIVKEDNRIKLESEINNEWQTHIKCNYTLSDKSRTQKLKLKTNLSENFYINWDIKAFDFITFGQRWVTCEKQGNVNKDNSEFLFSLCLDDKFKCEVENYYIYPVLFDIAVNLTLHCIGKEQSIKLCSIGSITVFKEKLPYKINVHIIRINDVLITSEYRYNIDLYDTEGKILISVNDYYIRAYTKQKQLHKSFTSYVNMFNEIKLSEINQDNKYRILFLGDESTQSVRYSKEILKKGHRVYFIDRRQSIDSINKYINDKNFDFVIVSCFNEKYENCFYNHFSYINILEFNFLKIISHLKGIKNKKIAYLMNSSVAINITDSIISPEYSGIRAMITAFSKENKDTNIRCFDVDLYSSVNTIIAEIVNGNQRFVVFRKNKAFCEFRKQNILCENETILSHEIFKTIIIVGNDGKSEMLFANHLKKKGFTNIVIFACCEIKDENANNFTVINIDILNQEEVIKATQKVRKRFGGILGVINLTDLISYGNLNDKSLQIYRHVFDMKATAVNNMHVATLSDKLKYFVTFSNINTAENLSGFSDFATGNAAVEALSIYRNQLGLNAVNICLPAYKFSHLDEVLKANCKKEKYNSIDFKDVFDVFDRIVFGNNINPVVIYGQQKDSEDYIN